MTTKLNLPEDLEKIPMKKRFNDKPRVRIAVDLDATLTNGEYYWKGDKPTPNQKVIDWVKKKYYEGNVILIHTARRCEEYRMTKAWLDEHGVLYHAIVLDKLAADIYLDDRNMMLEEIK